MGSLWERDSDPRRAHNCGRWNVIESTPRRRRSTQELVRVRLLHSFRVGRVLRGGDSSDSSSRSLILTLTRRKRPASARATRVDRRAQLGAAMERRRTSTSTSTGRVRQVIVRVRSLERERVWN